MSNQVDIKMCVRIMTATGICNSQDQSCIPLTSIFPAIAADAHAAVEHPLGLAPSDYCALSLQLFRSWPLLPSLAPAAAFSPP